MPRYVRARSAPRSADCWWEPPEHRSIDVYPSEPVDTGLLFPDGEPVMRVPDPIGFTTLKEQS